MSVIKEFKFPKDLLEKLAREGERTWKSTNIEDKADHFFNFCVTSLSLRDWCITFLELEGAKKNDFTKCTQRMSGSIIVDLLLTLLNTLSSKKVVVQLLNR